MHIKSINPFKSRPAFILAALAVVVGTHLLYRYMATEHEVANTPNSNKQHLPLPASQQHSQAAASLADAIPETVKPAPPREAAALYFLGKPVGSDGYAPFIRSALETGTAAEAFRASSLIQKCTDIHKDMERLLRLRSTSTNQSRNENYTRLIEENLTEERACQTVNGEILAMRAPLLIKAATGQEIGAAAIFIAENSSSAPNIREAMIKQLKTDAAKGHRTSIVMLGVSGASDFGLSSEEQLIYRDALQLILTHHPDEQIAANKPLRDLFGMLFDPADKSASPQHDEKVRALVDANVKLRKAGDDF